MVLPELKGPPKKTLEEKLSWGNEDKYGKDPELDAWFNTPVSPKKGRKDVKLEAKMSIKKETKMETKKEVKKVVKKERKKEVKKERKKERKKKEAVQEEDAWWQDDELFLSQDPSTKAVSGKKVEKVEEKKIEQRPKFKEDEEEEELNEDFHKSFHQLELFKFTKSGRINPPQQKTKFEIKQPGKKKLPSINQPHDALDMFTKQKDSKSRSKMPQMNKPVRAKKKVVTFEQEKQRHRMFKIPTMPKGRKMQITIFSTQGDLYYLGMAGIELFDAFGKQIKIGKKNISADPPDINILPGNNNDPRTVDKLVDGTYFTTSDFHQWLTPFTVGKQNLISISLKREETISMIRIWNYNTSRINSCRGAKDMKITLNGSTIFFGQMKQAPGDVKQVEAEYILFTEDEYIFGNIEKNDWLSTVSNQKGEVEDTELFLGMGILERPKTASKFFSPEDFKPQSGLIENDIMSDEESDEGFPMDGYKTIQQQYRPKTSAKRQMKQEKSRRKQQIELQKKELMRLTTKLEAKQQQDQQRIIELSQGEYVPLLIFHPFLSFKIECKKLTINIVQTWGDQYYVGLAGIVLLDEDYEPMLLEGEELSARPRDMNSIPGYSGDKRVLSNLINGNNMTVDSQEMWMIPFMKGKSHSVNFSFPRKTRFTGIRLWNYNKSPADAFRGAKIIIIEADGRLLTPAKGIVLRKAPGSVDYDYAQYVPLPFNQYWDRKKIILYKSLTAEHGYLQQEYYTPNLPMGMTVKLVLLSTWGDPHYIGLNGIEIFNFEGKEIIQEQAFDIFADPRSVLTPPLSQITFFKINDLPDMDGDLRVIDKIVNGQNKTTDDSNMWLAPFVSKKYYRSEKKLREKKFNSVVISFEKMVTIASINLWNYSKTVKRGVREFEIYLDDSLIYRGFLRKVQNTGSSYQGKTTILFTNSKNLSKQLKPQIYTEDGKHQTVEFNNEGKVLTRIKDIQQKEKESQYQMMKRPVTAVRVSKKFRNNFNN